MRFAAFSRVFVCALLALALVHAPPSLAAGAVDQRTDGPKVGASVGGADRREGPERRGAGLPLAARQEGADPAVFPLLRLVTLLQEPGGRLEPAVEDVKALGYGLAAVTYDRVGAGTLRRPGRYRLPAALRRGSKIIRAFGLLDPGQAKSTPWYGIARPMIVVLDADGIVRRRFSTQGYRDRPEVGAVLEALRGPGAS